MSCEFCFCFFSDCISQTIIDHGKTDQSYMIKIDHSNTDCASLVKIDNGKIEWSNQTKIDNGKLIGLTKQK